MKKLTNLQRDELIEQYTEIIVDNMDMDSLIQYAQEQMANHLDNLSDIEIKEDIDRYDEELYDNLVDNIISQPDIPLLTMNTDRLPDISDNEADGVTDDDIFIDINNTGGKY